MINNYKYGITPQELKEARKFIIRDIKSNNKVDNPIYDMTLQDYFNMIKECVLGSCNEKGIVTDPYFGNWCRKEKKQDVNTYLWYCLYKEGRLGRASCIFGKY